MRYNDACVFMRFFDSVESFQTISFQAVYETKKNDATIYNNFSVLMEAVTPDRSASEQ